jgi:hypothetical protein
MSVFRANNTPDTDWTVPVQRGPYPVNAPYADPDAPTERLVQPSDEPEPPAEPDGPNGPDGPAERFFDIPEPHRHLAVLVALVIASVALVASGVAWVVALRAMGQSGSMATMHLPMGAAPAGAASATARSAVAASPSRPPAAAPASADPALLYAQEPLQIQVGCGSSAKIDLDRPRGVGATDDKADLRYDNRCGPAGALFFIGTGARTVSHVTDPYLDRPGCADAIAGRPLDADEGVLVVKGTVLCVATADTIALVEVTGVAAHGAVTLRATAWKAVAGAAGVVGSTGASPGD